MLGLDIASMHTKFDHSCFSPSGDMVSAHQNLNGSRDLTKENLPKLPLPLGIMIPYWRRTEPQP